MSESNTPKSNDKPAAPATKADEPMREVLTKLLEGASHLSETDKQLGLKIRDLGLAAKDPLQFNDTSVQHQIASAVRDFERATGRPLDLSAAQQAEVTTLTARAPMLDVINKLWEAADHIGDTHKELAQKIQKMGADALFPQSATDTSFHREIASTVHEFEKATGKPLDLSTAQRAEVTKFTAQAGTPDANSAPKTDGTGQPSAGTQAPPDPIRDVLAKLVASVNQLPDSAKAVGNKIRELDKDAGDPVRFNQRSVQHEVAYAAQDFEKATGRQLELAPAQRTEVTKLATSAPGLENERMSALLSRTAQIDDHRLVQELRWNGAEIGRQSNQSTLDTQSRIEVLENKVRNAPRTAEPAHEAPAGEGAAKTEQGATNHQGNTTTNNARDRQRQQNDADPQASRNGAGVQQPASVQSSVLRGGILDTLTAALRGNGRPDNAPWDPQASPFGDRVTAFQAKVNARDQDRVIGRVETSARAAVDALDGFRNTEGATVMNRIQTAARAEPGGMQTVLSEMREGGRFSDLRQAFNTALNDDKGFAQAYDKAATALARYGEGREKVEQIIAKRPDAANLTAKFEQLDSQIGERASNTPSRNEGKNMLDDISKTIAEIIQKAADAVRSVFSRTAAPGSGPSVSPAA